MSQRPPVIWLARASKTKQDKQQRAAACSYFKYCCASEMQFVTFCVVIYHWLSKDNWIPTQPPCLAAALGAHAPRQSLPVTQACAKCPSIIHKFIKPSAASLLVVQITHHSLHKWCSPSVSLRMSEGLSNETRLQSEGSTGCQGCQGNNLKFDMWNLNLQIYEEQT